MSATTTTVYIHYTYIVHSIYVHTLYIHTVYCTVQWVSSKRTDCVALILEMICTSDLTIFVYIILIYYIYRLGMSLLMVNTLISLLTAVQKTLIFPPTLLYLIVILLVVLLLLLLVLLVE